MAMMTMLPRSSSQFRGRRHASITRLDYTSCRRHSHVVRRRTTITTNSSIATLVVGASGGTGRAALQGMLEGGIAAKDIYVATRTVHSSRAKELVRDLHVNVVQMDLDEPNSVATALKNSRAQAIYVHGTGADKGTADPVEEQRALDLAQAISTCTNIERVVYNSSGGPEREEDCRVSLMAQKRRIEHIYSNAIPTTTHLRATLFMEELWKKYTRPSTLKGTFPFSLPPDCSLQLLSVYDMGKCAARVIQSATAVDDSGDDDSLLEPFELVGKRIELAGDELTISQICAAFAAAQGIPRVKQLRLPMWLLRILNGELYNISAFYRDEGYHANIEANEEMFGIRLLTFPEFLARTHWSDTSVSYETMRYHDVTTNNNDDDDDEESEEEF